MRVKRSPSAARLARSVPRTIRYSSGSSSDGCGTAPAASNSTPLWTSRVASPPSSRIMLGARPSEKAKSWSVHHQYSSSVSPFHANTGVPAGASTVPRGPTTTAAAASSWVEKMLQDTQRTSAPSATSVSMSTAVCTVMCSDPAMRAPFSGCAAAYSRRIAIRPGISCSASLSWVRPASARDRSATAKSRPLRRVSLSLMVRCTPELVDGPLGRRAGATKKAPPSREAPLESWYGPSVAERVPSQRLSARDQDGKAAGKLSSERTGHEDVVDVGAVDVEFGSQHAFHDEPAGFVDPPGGGVVTQHAQRHLARAAPACFGHGGVDEPPGDAEPAPVRVDGEPADDAHVPVSGDGESVVEADVAGDRAVVFGDEDVLEAGAVVEERRAGRWRGSGGHQRGPGALVELGERVFVVGAGHADGAHPSSPRQACSTIPASSCGSWLPSVPMLRTATVSPGPDRWQFVTKDRSGSGAEPGAAGSLCTRHCTAPTRTSSVLGLATPSAWTSSYGANSSGDGARTATSWKDRSSRSSWYCCTPAPAPSWAAEPREAVSRSVLSMRSIVALPRVASSFAIAS